MDRLTSTEASLSRSISGLVDHPSQGNLALKESAKK